MKNKKLLALALLTAFGASNNISAGISISGGKIQIGRKPFKKIINEYKSRKASLQDKKASLEDLVDRLFENPGKFEKRFKALKEANLLRPIKEKITNDFKNEISRLNESLESIKDNLKKGQSDSKAVEDFTKAIEDLAKTAKETKRLFTVKEREAFQKVIEDVAKDGEKAINDIKGIKTQSVDKRLEALEEQVKATKESSQEWRRNSSDRAQRARKLSQEQINKAAEKLDSAFELGAKKAGGLTIYRGNDSLDKDVAEINKLIDAREDIYKIREEIKKFVTKATGLDFKPVDEDLKSYLDDIAKGLDALYPTLGKGRFRSKLDTMRNFLKEESAYTERDASRASTPRRLGGEPRKFGGREEGGNDTKQHEIEAY